MTISNTANRPCGWMRRTRESFEDVNLMLFHKVIALDNYRQKLIPILNIKTHDLESIITGKRAEELNNMKELFATNGEKAEHIPMQVGRIFNHCSTKQPIATWWRKPNITSERRYLPGGNNPWRAEGDGRSLLDALPVSRTTNPFSVHVLFPPEADGEIVVSARDIM